MNYLQQWVTDNFWDCKIITKIKYIYQLLLSITNETHNSLSSFETNKLNTNNSKRYELENNYVNRSYQYLDKLCGAKVMVIDWQNQLENETTNKYYAQTFNILPQIEQYKQIIKTDIETNRNITPDIFITILIKHN